MFRLTPALRACHVKCLAHGLPRLLIRGSLTHETRLAGARLRYAHLRPLPSCAPAPLRLADFLEDKYAQGGEGPSDAASRRLGKVADCPQL